MLLYTNNPTRVIWCFPRKALRKSVYICCQSKWTSTSGEKYFTNISGNIWSFYILFLRSTGVTSLLKIQDKKKIGKLSWFVPWTRNTRPFFRRYNQGTNDRIILLSDCPCHHRMKRPSGGWEGSFHSIRCSFCDFPDIGSFLGNLVDTDSPNLVDKSWLDLPSVIAASSVICVITKMLCPVREKGSVSTRFSCSRPGIANFPPSPGKKLHAVLCSFEWEFRLALTKRPPFNLFKMREK